MDDIWQQFHRLPRIIRDAVATPQALAAIDRIESANPGLDLAGFVMRVMIKEFPPTELAKRLVAEAGIEAANADRIVDELTRSVFRSVGEYLGLANLRVATPVPVAPTIPEPPPARPYEVATATPVEPPSTPPVRPTPMTVPAAPTGSYAPAPTLSHEDDAEIAAHSEKLRSMSSSPAGPVDFETIAQSIMAQHNLAFSEELLTKRAVSIMKTRLKQIRSADETKALLIRPPKVGGLGLDPDIATAVVTSLEQHVSTVVSRGMSQPPVVPPPPPPPRVPPPEQQKPAAIPPMTRDFRAMKPDPAVSTVTEPPRRSRPIYRPADLPPPPYMPEQATPTPKPSPVVTPSSAPVKSPAVVAPSPAMQRPKSADRPTVADITVPVSTLGPAEEMRSYTLVQFRRLGQGAGDATKKVLEKLQHLQQESFSLWADAVAGWRQSEVYRLYLDMGRESLEENVTIDKVVQHRAAAGKPYLSEHEFNALADMNRRLQF